MKQARVKRHSVNSFSSFFILNISSQVLLGAGCWVGEGFATKNVITRGFMHADCCISTAHRQLQPTGLLGVLLFKQMNIMQKDCSRCQEYKTVLLNVLIY